MNKRDSKSSGTGKAVVISVVLSALVTVGVSYALFPWLATNRFPEDHPAYDDGILLQSVFVRLDSQAYIFDDETDWSLMNQTTRAIVVQEGSRIRASFSANLLMTMGPSFTTKLEFQVALLVAGAGNATELFAFFDNTVTLGPSDYKQIVFDCNLVHQTGALAAGTYNVSVMWKSNYNAAGSQNSLSAGHEPSYPYARYLLIEEIR
ncbi:MAG: hypothetical protein Kow0069_17210 [Promethearchaeota archaeon]